MQFQDNYPLKNLTTLGIGGPAKKFVIVKTEEELIEAIRYTKDQKLPYLLIGSGSNLLVADEGFDGLVIKNEITSIKHISQIVTVKGGTLLQDLVDYTTQNRLSGLQKLADIPGTVGGAIYGNAGAYGQTISDFLTDVTVFDGKTIITLPKNQCTFTYRNSIFKKNKYPILEVTFQLKPGDPEILKKESANILAKRLIKYPPGIKCPGSFFKNLVAVEISPEILKKIPPEKIVYGKLPAGALLEEVGAKGQRSDGIEIASYHANLILNTGNGTAQAFYNLAKTYALKVKEKFDITLEPEVQLVNLPPFQ